MTPSEVGALAELSVASALMKAGLSVFVPFFNAHGRVDLVYLAADATVRRVQCKTSKMTDGVISFWVCSNTANQRKAYRDDIDEFGVYSPELDCVYLVPVGDVPERQARIRVDPARNNQQSGVRWAEPYLLGRP